MCSRTEIVWKMQHPSDFSTNFEFLQSNMGLLLVPARTTSNFHHRSFQSGHRILDLFVYAHLGVHCIF